MAASPGGMPAGGAAKSAGRERGLERDVVVTVALKLLDDVGFGGLTLRRLAERLKVKAAALYWHFENKQDLIDAMAERIMLTEFQNAHPKSTEWRDLLTMVAYTNRRALMRYRDGAQVVAHANMRHDHMLAGLELLLKSLEAQGFTLQQATSGFFTIIRFTIGCVFEEQTDPRNHDPTSAEKKAKHLQRFAKSHPTVAAAFAETMFGSGKGPDHMFQQGLTLILDGMALQHGKSA